MDEDGTQDRWCVLGCVEKNPLRFSQENLYVPGITSHHCLHICISAEAQLSFSLFFNLISWQKLHYWPCNLSLWWWTLYSPAPWIGTALFSGWQYNVQLYICVTAGIKSLNLLCEMYSCYNTGNGGNKIRKRTKEKAIMHLLALNINWLTVAPLKKKKEDLPIKEKSLCHEISNK